MADLDAFTGKVHVACGHGDDITQCGNCDGIWCDRCDPAHGPLCPWCHGYGYSTAAIALPTKHTKNHVKNNGGHRVTATKPKEV